MCRNAARVLRKAGVSAAARVGLLVVLPSVRREGAGPDPGRRGVYCMRPKRPLLKSVTAWPISSRVFITNGP
ncbi:hypothetical protein GCM10028797_09050 [Dyella agri]